MLRILAGNHKANPRFWREFKLNGVSDNKRTEDNKKKIVISTRKSRKKTLWKGISLAG